MGNNRNGNDTEGTVPIDNNNLVVVQMGEYHLSLHKGGNAAGIITDGKRAFPVDHHIAERFYWQNKPLGEPPQAEDRARGAEQQDGPYTARAESMMFTTHDPHGRPTTFYVSGGGENPLRLMHEEARLNALVASISNPRAVGVTGGTHEDAGDKSPSAHPTNAGHRVATLPPH